MLKLRILGCSGGVGQGLRTTSLLVNDSVLIDAGSGVGELTLEEMSQVKHLFITHSHLDHINFLPLLLDSMFETLIEPIIVHAQPVTIRAIQDHIFNWTIWPDFTKLPSPEKAVVQFVEMLPNEKVVIDGHQYEMIEVSHIVPAVGYRVEFEGKSFAFSGDTSSNDSFWNNLNNHKNLDMLIVETAFPEALYDLALKARHYTPSLLVEDLKKLRHNPDIYLTHLKPGAENQIINEVKAADPSLSLKILQSGSIFEL
ncbi:MAG: 3',5'-cyclic-nucleotide phosphodiesterase [Gammaproteobacteria bacterium]|nr:3',5'-cyclic-nucleotide phosphodiesterase [Gammaproteobacteria bacterium]